MDTNFDWYELDDDMGDAGLPGTGITEGELTALQADIDAIMATPVPASITDLDDVSDTAATEGQYYQMVSGTITPVTLDLDKTVPFGVTLVANGGGSEPSAGTVGIVYFWFDCEITGCVVNSNPSGSVEWDLRVGGVSIVGTEKPATSSAFVKTVSSFSGWTTTITAGTSVEFLIVSATTTTISSINVGMERTI